MFYWSKRRWFYFFYSTSPAVEGWLPPIRSTVEECCHQPSQIYQTLTKSEPSWEESSNMFGIMKSLQWCSLLLQWIKVLMQLMWAAYTLSSESWQSDSNRETEAAKWNSAVMNSVNVLYSYSDFSKSPLLVRMVYRNCFIILSNTAGADHNYFLWFSEAQWKKSKKVCLLWKCEEIPGSAPGTFLVVSSAHGLNWHSISLTSINKNLRYCSASNRKHKWTQILWQR